MTAPARRSFDIIARHTGFVFCFGFVLPVKARVRPHKLGVSHLPRSITATTILLLLFPRNRVAEMRGGLGDRFCPCASNAWWHVTIFPGRTGSGTDHGGVHKQNIPVALRATWISHCDVFAVGYTIHLDKNILSVHVIVKFLHL